MTETISSQYTVREMLAALKYAAPKNTFLLDRLVKNIKTHTTKYVEIDVEKAGRTIAAYVSRVGDPEVVSKPGYDSKIHVLPYTKQRMVLTEEDLETRLPGDTIYDVGSPSERRDELVGKWLAELDKRIVRREELQLAQAITTGKAEIEGNDVSYEINYGRDAGNEVALVGTAKWGGATADIPQDFKNAGLQLTKPGVDGGSPNAVYLGIDASKYFIDEATTSDTKLKNMMDMRRLESGQINLEVLREQDVTYIGTFRDVGIDVEVFSYYARYVDENGAEQYYIDPDDAIFINESLRVDQHYSKISNLKSSFVGRRFPSSWIADDGSAEYMQLESGPLVAPHQIDSTYRLKTQG